MEKKIFDDFTDVDCNYCANYYTDACDGVSEGVKRPCKSFIAHRGINIPKEINALKSALKSITDYITFLTIVLILYWAIPFVYEILTT